MSTAQDWWAKKAGARLEDVDWETVQLLEPPPDFLPAPADTRCVFAPSCSTLHHANTRSCVNCGGQGKATCLEARLRDAAARFPFGPEDTAWVCPPCCYQLQLEELGADPEPVLVGHENLLTGPDIEGHENPPSEQAVPEPETLRALINQLQAVVSAQNGQMEELKSELKKQNRAVEELAEGRLGSDFVVQRVMTWKPYIGNRTAVDRILEELRRRYLVEGVPTGPDAPGTNEQHDRRLLLNIVSRMRTSEEVWLESSLRSLHTIVVRLEHLKYRTDKSDHFTVALARAVAYETYADRVEWDAFTSKEYGVAVLHGRKAESVKEAEKAAKAKAAAKEARPAPSTRSRKRRWTVAAQGDPKKAKN